MELTEKFVTENLSIWSSALNEKPSAGRGQNEKIELYGIRKFRELIMALAVRGMLVPKNKKDEPAAKLLQRISKEKSQLFKEGKLKRQKKFPPISHEEIPFKAPHQWEWVRLGVALKKITDGTHHSPPNGQIGEYRYISAKNIKRDGVQLDNATWVTKEVHEQIFSRCDPELGDILYIKDGATTGITTINDLDEPFSMLSSVALLKCPEGVLNSFILLALRSPYFYQAMRSGMTGVAITRITLKKLENAIIPLPPLDEQHRIVAKVDQFMTLCDQLEKAQANSIVTQNNLVTTLLNKLSFLNIDTYQLRNAWKPVQTNFDTLFTTEKSIDQLKKTILQLAISGKIVSHNLDDEPASELLKKILIEKEELIQNGIIRRNSLPSFSPKQEVLLELPTEWEWAPLGIIGIIFNGNSINSQIKEEKYTNIIGRPYLSTKDIGYGFESLNYNNGISIPADETNFKTASKDSVLICSEGGSAGKKCGITDREICFGNKLYANELHANINPRFILYFYLTPMFYKQFTQSMKGIIGGVSVSKFAQIQCPLPPLPEQNRIVAKVDQLISICDQLKKNIHSAKEIKINLSNSIINKAIS